MPEGTLCFPPDFNRLREDPKTYGLTASNELTRSLLSHLHYFARLTGDRVGLDRNDVGSRIRFLDYPGKGGYDHLKQHPPKRKSDETELVRRNGRGVEALGDCLRQIKEKQ